jgi:hypothetical protein
MNMHGDLKSEGMEKEQQRQPHVSNPNRKQGQPQVHSLNSSNSRDNSGSETKTLSASENLKEGRENIKWMTNILKGLPLSYLSVGTRKP